jgi:hypothetical protein
MERGVVVWVTGAEEAACLCVADAIADRLTARRIAVEQLDGRTAGIAALAGDAIDRRAAFAAGALARPGVTTVVAVASPTRAARAAIRAELGRMIEVYVPGGTAAEYEPPDRPEVEAAEPGATASRTMRSLELLGLLAAAADTAYTVEEERQVIRRLKSFGYL